MFLALTSANILLRTRFTLTILNISLALTAIAMFTFALNRISQQSLATLGIALAVLTVLAALYLPTRMLVVHESAYVVSFVVTGYVADVALPLLLLAVTLGGCILIAVVVHRLVQAWQMANWQLQWLVDRDPLTGLLNRRGAESHARGVHALAQRSLGPTTVAVIDIDGFKAVNDNMGHDAGDQVLRELARQWSQMIRSGDVLGRMGGDEFMLIMPNTDTRTAHALLRRMREVTPIPWSHGVTEWADDEDLSIALLRADRAMYRAKRQSADSAEADNER